MAHSILIIVYHLIQRGSVYQALGANYYDKRKAAAVQSQLVNGQTLGAARFHGHFTSDVTSRLTALFSYEGAGGRGKLACRGER